MQDQATEDRINAVIDDLRNGKSKTSKEMDFRGASLRGVDLSGLNLSGADFTEADLSNANLSNAKLFKASLHKASLAKAILDRAELTGADLSEANLEEAQAKDVGLGMSNLSHARLFNANFTNATFTKANLSDTDSRCVIFFNCRMRETNLTNADLTGSDLREVDMAISVVGGAVFNNADMRGIRLRSVEGFEKAEWIGVDIRDINFAGAYRLRRFVVDQNYLKEFRDSNAFNRYVYYLWRITSDCGRSLRLWCFWIVVISLLFAWIYSLVDVDYGKYPNWISPIYYSVVTLTTLGYGDIVPASPAARVVAIFEVMIGYLMLGGLLSIFANRMARRGE